MRLHHEVVPSTVRRHVLDGETIIVGSPKSHRARSVPIPKFLSRMRTPSAGIFIVCECHDPVDRSVRDEECCAPGLMEVLDHLKG